MHHKKGWMNRRKEDLFRLRFKTGLKRGKTRWVPRSLVAKILEALTHKLEAEND